MRIYVLRNDLESSTEHPAAISSICLLTVIAFENKVIIYVRCLIIQQLLLFVPALNQGVEVQSERTSDMLILDYKMYFTLLFTCIHG